ncbi:hypothetical protein Tco_0739316 [Tanacetum coccineum]
MMDIYDDRFKDVCEPKSNDSSSPTSDPVARRRFCFTSNLENFRIIHQGRVIHSPQIASVGDSSLGSCGLGGAATKDFGILGLLRKKGVVEYPQNGLAAEWGFELRTPVVDAISYLGERPK